MAIFLRQSHNVNPRLWGSFADRQYAIWRNLEDIYRCNHETEVLIMPGFWGLPLLDYSKYGNHGINHGATYDGGLSFDGNDYVEVLDTSSLSPGAGNFSIFLCIKTSTTDTWNAILWNYGLNDNNLYYINLAADNTVGGYYRDGEGDFISTSTIAGIVNDGQWHKLVSVRDGTTGYLYLDGIQVDTDINALLGTVSVNSGNPLELGRYTLPTGEEDQAYFNGLVKEVRIAKATRTADQIALFQDLPWGLYWPVSRPIYSIPAAPSIFIPRAVIC